MYEDTSSLLRQKASTTWQRRATDLRTDRCLQANADHIHAPINMNQLELISLKNQLPTSSLQCSLPVKERCSHCLSSQPSPGGKSASHGVAALPQRAPQSLSKKQIELGARVATVHAFHDLEL